MHERGGLQKGVEKGWLRSWEANWPEAGKCNFKEPEEDGLQAHHCTEVCEWIHEAFTVSVKPSPYIRSLNRVTGRKINQAEGNKLKDILLRAVDTVCNPQQQMVLLHPDKIVGQILCWRNRVYAFPDMLISSLRQCTYKDCSFHPSLPLAAARNVLISTNHHRQENHAPLPHPAGIGKWHS
jgi:hypothetical protein